MINAWRVAVLLCASGGAGLAEQKPRVVTPVGPGRTIQPLAASLSAISATPTTISFTATDPDLGTVAGTPGAVVSWTTSGGSTSSTWALSVRAGSASFTNCATLPRSAVSVACDYVTGGLAGVCGSPITLSFTAQQVASGREATTTAAPYSVGLSFSLADSWSYIARQSPKCTLSITYTVNAP